MCLECVVCFLITLIGVACCALGLTLFGLDVLPSVGFDLGFFCDRFVCLLVFVGYLLGLRVWFVAVCFDLGVVIAFDFGLIVLL